MRCVSLFSGCGGLDLGFARAGFEIVLANDNDRTARRATKQLPRDAPSTGSVTDVRRGSQDGSLGCTDDRTSTSSPAARPARRTRSRASTARRSRARWTTPSAWETITGYLETLELLRPRAFSSRTFAGFAYKVHREALDRDPRRRADGSGYEYVVAGSSTPPTTACRRSASGSSSSGIARRARSRSLSRRTRRTRGRPARARRPAVGHGGRSDRRPRHRGER